MLTKFRLRVGNKVYFKGKKLWIVKDVDYEGVWIKQGRKIKLVESFLLERAPDEK